MRVQERRSWVCHQASFAVWFEISFEEEASIFESVDDCCARFQWNEDEVGPIACDEEDRSGNVSEVKADQSWAAYILASARGLLRSSTLWPASKPSPPITITE